MATPVTRPKPLDSTIDPCPEHGEDCAIWRAIGEDAYTDEVRQIETYETAREGCGS